MTPTHKNMADELRVPVLSIEEREERCYLVLVTKAALAQVCHRWGRRQPDPVICSARTDRQWSSVHVNTRNFGVVQVCYESPASVRL